MDELEKLIKEYNEKELHKGRKIEIAILDDKGTLGLNIKECWHSNINNAMQYEEDLIKALEFINSL